MDESGAKGLEEERRLAYVGLTRARRRAIVSHAANRRIYANWQTSIPSRFIEELPDAHVEHAGSAALQRDRMLAAPTVFTGQFPLMARRPTGVEVWEQPPRPARAGRDRGRHAGVPPEIRLRHGDRDRGRPARHRVRQGGQQARARPLRGAGVTTGPAIERRGMGRYATGLETVSVRVPEVALRGLRGGAGVGVRHGRLLPATRRRGEWVVEGVKPEARARRRWTPRSRSRRS